jgi:hypothetical protein
MKAVFVEDVCIRRLMALRRRSVTAFPCDAQSHRVRGPLQSAARTFVFQMVDAESREQTPRP